jgi:hypothetical protein
MKYLKQACSSVKAKVAHISKNAMRYWDRLMCPIQQIKSLLEDLSPDELLTLIEHIAQRLRQREARKPQPLYGIWRGKFPEDVDIDATLKEVRQQWQQEIEGLAE